MTTNRKPQTVQLDSVSLKEILTSIGNNDIYAIENLYQRPLVWSYQSVYERFFKDVFECISNNISSSKKDRFTSEYNSSWSHLGILEQSQIDEDSKEYVDELSEGHYRSIVDGSQRYRIAFITAVAFEFCIAEQKGYDFINLDQFYINGIPKLTEIGTFEFDRFLDRLKKTTVHDLCLKISQAKPEQLSKDEDNVTKKDYFGMFSIIVERIREKIATDFSLEEAFKIYMCNTYFHIDNIPYDEKLKRFEDRNSKGTPMTDADLYPKLIINSNVEGRGNKQKIFEKYNEFMEVAESLTPEKENEENKTTFRETKSCVRAPEFIMIKVLQALLGKESLVNPTIDLTQVFRSTFKLSNAYYGIRLCIENGILFDTVEKRVQFFELCKKYALFIKNDSLAIHKSIFDDSYFYRDFSKENVLWWYFYDIAYIKFFEENEDLKEALTYVSIVLYLSYCINRMGGSTNSQALIDKTLMLSMYYWSNSDSNSDKINKFKAIAREYLASISKKTDGDYYERIKSVLTNASYTSNGHINMMKIVLSLLEFEPCANGLQDREVFKKMFTRKSNKTLFDLDHILPKDNFKDEDDQVKRTFNTIGNLTLLEPSLNNKKGNDSQNNPEIYRHSESLYTRLLNKNYIYEPYNNYNLTLEAFRTDETTLKCPTVDFVNERTAAIVNGVCNFVRKHID